MTTRKKKPIPVQTAFDAWHNDPAYMAELAALEDEFSLADLSIKARGVVGLRPQELEADEDPTVLHGVRKEIPAHL